LTLQKEGGAPPSVASPSDTGFFRALGAWDVVKGTFIQLATVNAEMTKKSERNLAMVEGGGAADKVAKRSFSDPHLFYTVLNKSPYFKIHLTLLAMHVPVGGLEEFAFTV